MLTYWDANVFLSYLEGAANRSVILNDIVREAREEKRDIITSTLTITEVAFVAREKESGALDPRIEQALDNMFDDEQIVRLVEVDRPIARHAQRLIREALVTRRSLKPADAVHLATAHRAQCDVIHSYDRQLRSLSELIQIPAQIPTTDQPSLPDLLGASDL